MKFDKHVSKLTIQIHRKSTPWCLIEKRLKNSGDREIEKTIVSSHIFISK